MRYESILEAIGRTPIIRLRHLTEGLAPKIYIKAEYLNPGGSVKDRIAVSMIDDAEKRGLLKPGGTIIEGTSGNTGMGLALVAAVRGYKCIFTITDKQSREKIDLLKALGAEVIVCPTAVEPEDPRSYYSIARKLSMEIPNSYYPNQYDNLSNPEAHYDTTGPEIWDDTDGTITHFVAGMGTGGTISGVARYLKEKNPAVKIIGADPIGSIYHEYFHEGTIGEAHTYVVEGIGEDILPKAMDFSVVDDVRQVTDKESFQVTRRMASLDGIFAGGSCGAAVAVGLEVAKELGPDDVMVILLPDTGMRYLSKIYNDEWMRENQYLETHVHLSAKQMVENKRKVKEMLSANPSESLRSVTERMREFAVSQLPVMEDGQPIGSLSETLIMQRMLDGVDVDKVVVREVMGEPFPVVSRNATIEEITALVPYQHEAVLVANAGRYDIITKSDVVYGIANQSRGERP